MDDETGEEKLYEGGTMLQLRKSFSVCARAAGAATDPVEEMEAKKAIFLGGEERDTAQALSGDGDDG